MTALQWLYTVIQVVLNGWTFYYSAGWILGTKGTKRGLLITLAILFVLAISSLFLVERLSALAFLQLIAAYMLIAWLGMGLRGWRIGVGGLMNLGYFLLMDMLSAVSFSALMGPETWNSVVNKENGLMQLMMAAYMSALMFAVGWVAKTLRLRGQNLEHQQRHWIYIARPAVLLALTVLTALLCQQRVHLLTSPEQIWELCANCLLCGGMFFVSASYILQDVRFFTLLNERNSLQQQQRVNDLILNEMRTFRHNIFNMIYGFEGAIMAGDVESIQSYYREMSKRCAVINNENAYSVRRLQDASVAALMMRKMERARTMNVPFFLNVQEDLQWKRVSAPLACEVLGVLLDNALEAATESDTPYVAVNVTSDESSMEIDVKNTARAIPCFPLPESSSKQGHEGQGLRSVRQLLAKQNKLYLNQFAVGRYVHSILSIS